MEPSHHSLTSTPIKPNQTTTTTKAGKKKGGAADSDHKPPATAPVQGYLYEGGEEEDEEGEEEEEEMLVDAEVMEFEVRLLLFDFVLCCVFVCVYVCVCFGWLVGLMGVGGVVRCAVWNVGLSLDRGSVCLVRVCPLSVLYLPLCVCG
jgi:hypothetical protein